MLTININHQRFAFSEYFPYICRMEHEEIIRRAKLVQQQNYDYSLVKDSDSDDVVEVVCPIHGKFYPRVKHLVRGTGCPKCAGKAKKTTEEYIKECIAVWGDAYDYSETEYVKARADVTVICPKHGKFSVNASAHVHEKRGCRKCHFEKLHSLYCSNTEEFIQKAEKVHNYRYDLSEVNYVNNKTPVKIKCKKCGRTFTQTPQGHLSGRGCPFCNESKLEKKVMDLLDSNGIEYIYQWHLPWLKRFSLDFYLPKHNLGIECQGIQHFDEINHFDRKEGIKERDEIKLRTCAENGIKIVYFADYNYDFPYDVITEESKLIELLKENGKATELYE